MMQSNKYRITTLTGIAIVLANMIGTGAFTSLGLQLVHLTNPSVIITLWLLGGLMAISGAFSYAEVGTLIRKSGGEYAFLSEIYNPLIGYLSGWISLTVGFAAPIALSAIAFIEYFPVGHANTKLIGIFLVAVITLIHTKNLKVSSYFQIVTTAFKVIVVLTILTLGLIYPGSGDAFQTTNQNFFPELLSGAFFIALIYVSYAYSGWNAAAYITEEFKNPLKSLPAALLGGTLIVTTLYTLLQFIFLKHASISELTGKINVGEISMSNMLGTDIGNLFSLIISLLLVSGISAMVWVGPRVTASMSDQHKLWNYFKINKKGIPTNALWLQFVISAILILTGTFNQILIYCGVLLTLSSMMVVFSVFIIRYQSTHKHRQRYRSPLFPFFQIIFLLLSTWMVVFAFANYPLETSIGLVNLLVGVVTFYFSKKLESW